MSSFNLEAQRKKKKVEKADEISLEAFKFRNIGPAFLSGRIADIAVHPDNDNVWYVAVGSGGVWKTENSGTTWSPIFDDQASYSTGCITIDPNDPARIWVGSGENVGGRHVGYGDGVYLSPDSGATWKNMGLKNSEHISKIVVHPNNSDVVWVASQGPLWKKGGERGVYKTTNGGKNWKRVLGNSEWTGATDLLIDPNDPQILYAATWDRHRTVAAYMGGGPGSGIHRSTDGGETWEKLSNGLPKSNMGKIGLALSPQQSNVVKQGVYNTQAGPDFSNAQLKIDQLDWVGHVEIHLKSSDWFAHQHHQDSNYDAVILHVVWEDDVPVVTQSGMPLPSLELSKIVSPILIKQYKKQFLQRPQWIPCEEQIHTIDSMIWTHWKERLFIERIERKSKLIEELLKQFKNDWEAVCFMLLAKNFGLNVNGASFLEVAKAIPFHVIRKNWDEVGKLEALFMGMSGMLNPPYNDFYQETLGTTYSYLKRKHQFQTIEGLSMQYSRLRPINFPTIRWAQLAQLYSSTQGLFSRFIQKEDQFNTAWLAAV